MPSPIALIGPMTPSISPYVARQIAFLELWRPGHWMLKVYGIAYGRPGPRPVLVDAAKRLALQLLPPQSPYAVGFVGAHDARGGCYAFVDWWANENELHHKNFLGPSPDELRPAGPDDSTACVWDLAVVDFERRAWHELVVKQAGAPDLGAYLARHFEETV
jgi:hypothetical protein